MRAHLRALADHLGELGYPVHLFYAHPVEGQSGDTVPEVPYLVLRAAWSPGEDLPFCDETDDLDTSALITAAATTAEGVSVVLDRVRKYLSPSGAWSDVPMAGRLVNVKWLRNEVEPTVDRDLRLPNSNRHPGYGVDRYRLLSQPKEES